jgi:uncharacterized protein
VRAVNNAACTLTNMVSVEVFQLFRSLVFESIGQSLGLNGEVVDQVEYAAGVAIGRALAQNGTVRGESLDLVMHGLAEFYARAGLGSMYHSLDGAGMLTVGLYECTGCMGMELVHHPVCHLEAGIIRGVVSEFTGHEFSIREVNCIGGLGDSACVFELTP